MMPSFLASSLLDLNIVASALRYSSDIPVLVSTLVICQTPPSVYGAVAVVPAADAEFCAGQTLTVPASAAIMIATLNIFVNFILVFFLVGWLYPGGMELISSRGELSSWRGLAHRLARGTGYTWTAG